MGIAASVKKSAAGTKSDKSATYVDVSTAIKDELTRLDNATNNTQTLDDYIDKIVVHSKDVNISIATDEATVTSYVEKFLYRLGEHLENIDEKLHVMREKLGYFRNAVVTRCQQRYTSRDGSAKVTQIRQQLQAVDELILQTKGRLKLINKEQETSATIKSLKQQIQDLDSFRNDIETNGSESARSVKNVNLLNSLRSEGNEKIIEDILLYNDEQTMRKKYESVLEDSKKIKSESEELILSLQSENSKLTKQLRELQQDRGTIDGSIEREQTRVQEIEEKLLEERLSHEVEVNYLKALVEKRDELILLMQRGSARTPGSERLGIRLSPEGLLYDAQDKANDRDIKSPNSIPADNSLLKTEMKKNYSENDEDTPDSFREWINEFDGTQQKNVAMHKERETCDESVSKDETKQNETHDMKLLLDTLQSNIDDENIQDTSESEQDSNDSELHKQTEINKKEIILDKNVQLIQADKHSGQKHLRKNGTIVENDIHKEIEPQDKIKVIKTIKTKKHEIKKANYEPLNETNVSGTTKAQKVIAHSTETSPVFVETHSKETKKLTSQSHNKDTNQVSKDVNTYTEVTNIPKGSTSRIKALNKQEKHGKEKEEETNDNNDTILGDVLIYDQGKTKEIIYRRSDGDIDGNLSYHKGIGAVIRTTCQGFGVDSVHCEIIDDLENDMLPDFVEGERPISFHLHFQKNHATGYQLKEGGSLKIFVPHRPIDDFEEASLIQSTNGGDWEPCDILSESPVSVSRVVQLVGTELMDLQDVKLVVIAREKADNIVAGESDLVHRCTADNSITVSIKKTTFPTRAETRIMVHHVHRREMLSAVEIHTHCQHVMSCTAFVSILCEQMTRDDIDIHMELPEEHETDCRYTMFSLEESGWKLADCDWDNDSKVIVIHLRSGSRKYRVIGLELPMDLSVEEKLLAVRTIHEHTSHYLVRLLFRQKENDPAQAVIICLRSKLVKTGIVELKDLGYSVGGFPSSQFCLVEGETLSLDFTGDIAAKPINSDKLELTFYCQKEIATKHIRLEPSESTLRLANATSCTLQGCMSIRKMKDIDNVLLAETIYLQI